MKKGIGQRVLARTHTHTGIRTHKTVTEVRVYVDIMLWGSTARIASKVNRSRKVTVDSDVLHVY